MNSSILRYKKPTVLRPLSTTPKILIFLMILNARRCHRRDNLVFFSNGPPFFYCILFSLQWSNNSHQAKRSLRSRVVVILRYLPFRLLSVGRRIANNRWLPKFSPRPLFEAAAAAVVAPAHAAAAAVNSADYEYDKRHFFDEWMRGRFF